MTARKRIAATALLAALAVPALAGCGDDGGSSQASAATTAALAVRQQAAADLVACSGGARYPSTACYTQLKQKYGERCADGVEIPERTYERFHVASCADELIRAAGSGTPLPTATPTGGVTVTATTTAPATSSAPTAAPMQASGGHGIGSAISGLFSTLLSLALGFLCIFGIPGLIGWMIYRRVRADRRERAHAQAVHREEGSWQESDDYRPYAAPDQYDAPTEPEHNPWA